MLLCGANHDPAASRARNGPLDQDHVLSFIELEHTNIPHRDLFATVSPRHPLALHDPRRIGTGTDGSTVAMHALYAVTGTLAVEIVPLHDAGKTTPLGQSDQVDAGHFIENSDINGLTDLKFVRFAVRAEFANEPLGLTIGLLDRLEAFT